MPPIKKTTCSCGRTLLIPQSWGIAGRKVTTVSYCECGCRFIAEGPGDSGTGGPDEIMYVTIYTPEEWAERRKELEKNTKVVEVSARVAQ